ACGRHSDHFPFMAYSDINPSNCFGAGNCSNIFGGTSTSCSGHTCTTGDFISAANSTSPPNLLWFTPSDNHNMHNNNVSGGDTYLKNFLVGSSGNITNPAAGSLLKTKIFGTDQRTLLILWWDEYANPPEIFYGPTLKQNYVSSSVYDHYSTLRMIQDNWGLTTLTSNDVAATGMLAEFGARCGAPTLTTIDTVVGNNTQNGGGFAPGIPNKRALLPPCAVNGHGMYIKIPNVIVQTQEHSSDCATLANGSFCDTPGFVSQAGSSHWLLLEIDQYWKNAGIAPPDFQVGQVLN